MRIDYRYPSAQQVDRFLYSPAYFVYLGGLTILSNVFELELFAYTCILLTAMYICLHARDLLPLLPMFPCGYISPSVKNNPGLTNESVFTVAGGGLYLAVLVAVLIACLVYRLVKDPDFGGKKFLTKKRKLLPGMLLLGATYVISGIGSGQWAEYGWRNLLFAFFQIAAIAGVYYLLSGAVRWDMAPKAYLFWTGICLGYVLLIEVLGIYIKESTIVDGVIRRDRLHTGWGHYNNIGAMFAMVIPLPFFLTGKGKYAWFAYVSAFLFCIGLLFSCSRWSILVGVPMYLVTYFVSLFHSRHARSIKWMHVLHAVIIGSPIVVLIVFNDELARLFQVLPDLISEISMQTRMNTYKEGFRQFAQFPIFGGSFFPLADDLYQWAGSHTTFAYLFPPRWHNTVVQLLASGGVVSLAAYVVHRVQTVKLFTRNFTSEKLFAGLSIVAMLLTSMMDCHFFNVGPVLLYSAILTVVEFQLNKTTEE